MIHQEVPYFQANPNFETDKSLVGGLDHVLFFHMLGRITPTDFHVYSEGLKPPTRSCYNVESF